MADAHKNEMAETAWASGLFEGEGCIHVGFHKSGNRRIQLALGMTDRDVVERFAAWAGLGSISHQPRSDENHRDMWVWCTAGKQTIPIIEKMLPYLGERRSARAAEAFAAAVYLGTANKDKTHCPSGHSLDDAYIRKADGSRRCKPCSNARSRERRLREAQVA